MKNIYLSLFSGLSLIMSAQVGINNSTPAATLDVTAKAGAISTVAEGLIAPRLSRSALIAKDNAYSSLQSGTLIYVLDTTGTLTTKTVNVTTSGYYYYDGNVWQKITGTSNIYTASNALTMNGNDVKLGGALTGNTTVTQGTNTLAFTSTVNNGFSIDSPTLSVDAVNHRLGIGTISPSDKLEINGNAIINNSSSAYGSYLVAQNSQGVNMSLQATSSTSPFGARGIVGTNSAHPLQLIYDANPVIYMNNSTFSPNGSNITSLGSDMNRWNTVYSGGSGFDANNASSNYVGLETQCKEGVRSMFGASSSTSVFGKVVYMGSKTNDRVAFMINSAPVFYMDGRTIYPNGNNTMSIGYNGTAALANVYSYAFNNPSDIRLKKNIENLTYGLKDVMKIRAVSYDLKDEKNEHKMLGFIAQEMEKIIPEIISTNKDEAAYKSIDYVKMVPVLVKAIQEQQTKIESQEKRIEELNSIINKRLK